MLLLLIFSLILIFNCVKNSLHTILGFFFSTIVSRYQHAQLVFYFLFWIGYSSLYMMKMVLFLLSCFWCHLQPCLSCSLKALHKKLIGGRVFHSENVLSVDWHNDQEVEHAVWKLMRMCSSDDTSCIRELVSDFVSRVLIFYIVLLRNTLFLLSSEIFLSLHRFRRLV